VTELGRLAWPAVGALPPATVLAVPVGSTEQHGPHLPLATDTQVAVALADALARRRSDVVVAPALPYGSSGEHAGFAGTLSIGQAALELVLVELVRSADRFAGVVLVNGHGGNHEPLGRAEDRLRAEGRRVLAWSPRPGPGPGAAATDAHAGRTETSVMLAIDPASVRLADAAPGNRRPLPELLPAMRDGGVAAVTANGVLGDPAGASAAEGAAIVEAMLDDLCAAVDRWLGPARREVSAPGRRAVRP
jgi:creatinine amidohydrolase